MEIAQLQSGQKGESSQSLRKKVIRAREFQDRRYAGTGLRFNADLNAGNIEKYCFLEKPEQAFIGRLFQKMQFSARAYHRILKVARTVADLEESERITVGHLSEAVCYRAGEKLYER